MFCQACKKNEATIHLTEITDGQRAETHLCPSCAAEQGVAMQSHIPINELLSSLLAAVPDDGVITDSADKNIACPNCGFTLEQFRKDAMLGCPQDYEVFEKALVPLIGKAHAGKTSHCGKVPAGMPADTKKQMEISQLRQKLTQAVKTEDYELAAGLRDQISELEE